MNKSNFKYFISATIFLCGFSAAHAQGGAKAKPATTGTASAPAQTSSSAGTTASGKKRIKLDYENDVVMGVYDTPDASFINSRRMIKYKELFNRRTNFIDEIESNKGLFNEYQK